MKSNKISLKEAVHWYLAHLEEAGHHPITIRAYQSDYQLILSYFAANILLEDIRSTQVGKFYKSNALLFRVNGEPRAANTVSRIVRVFRMLMVWCLSKGYIQQLPLPKSTPMGRHQQLS